MMRRAKEGTLGKGMMEREDVDIRVVLFDHGRELLPV
jgi:hypothetical protein